MKMDKHYPVRMCVICRGRFPKEELTRYILSDGLLQIDATQRHFGRGWYLCADSLCLKKFEKYRPVRKRKGEHYAGK